MPSKRSTINRSLHIYLRLLYLKNRANIPYFNKKKLNKNIIVSTINILMRNIKLLYTIYSVLPLLLNSKF